jgi:hypothetical protein
MEIRIYVSARSFNEVRVAWVEDVETRQSVPEGCDELILRLVVEDGRMVCPNGHVHVPVSKKKFPIQFFVSFGAPLFVPQMEFHLLDLLSRVTKKKKSRGMNDPLIAFAGILLLPLTLPSYPYPHGPAEPSARRGLGGGGSPAMTMS